MPVSFHILPERFLVYVRFEGAVLAEEGFRSFAAFLAHPDYRKGMRQLVDLSAMTAWEQAFVAIMAHQAREAEVHDDPGRPTLVVALAPHPVARSLAQHLNRSWEHTGRLVAVTVETEAEALSVLGIDAPSFAEMVQRR